MTDANSRDLLRRLCLAAGPPGAEDEVRRIVRRELAGLGELSHDRLGSVLCEKTGQSDGPRVVLDSHLDEVAFLVLALLDFSLNMDVVLPELADPQRPERLLQLAFQGLSKR